jgi:hypothetical protein
MREFITEDDLKTFERWLRYQGVDAARVSPEELEEWRRAFDEVQALCSAAPRVGLMKLRSIPNEHRYAVAVREGSDLWLTLWVRRSPKGEFFVLVPRADQEWDVHTSYHLDGTLHLKSYDNKVFSKKSQPLTGTFRGTEQLGAYSGHAPKSVSAICEPTAFNGVVEVGPDLLGPIHGTVTVDLVEPGCEPIVTLPKCEIVRREVFRDFTPWVVITIWSRDSYLQHAQEVCAYFHWIKRGRPLWEAEVDWEWAVREIPE